MNERQRTCKDRYGKLLYHDWQCTKCKNWYESKIIAHYCCEEVEEMKR